MNWDLLRTPSEHNIAWSWVMALMPDGDTPWAHATANFAAPLAFIGSLFLAWHVVSGIVHSAYTGKVLGEKYHQIWAPLRVVIGFGMLVPIAGGFSSGHYLLRDVVARIGINLADNIWVGYVEHVAGNKVQIIPSATGGSRLVLDILEHEICAAVHNRMVEPLGLRPAPQPAASGDRTGEAGWLPWSPIKETRTQWSYGQDCGHFYYPVLDDRPEFTTAREIAVSQIVSTVRGTVGGYADFFSRHHQAQSATVAIALVNDGRLPELVLLIRRMGAEFDKTIADAAAEELKLNHESEQNRRKLIEAARQEGFVNAGAYWRNLADISAQVTALTGQQHSRTGIRAGDGASTSHEHIQAALSTLRYHIAGEEAAIGLTANDLTSAGDESTDLLTKILAPLQRSFAEWAFSKGDPSLSVVERIKRSDPMGDMIASGHFFMNAVAAVITGAAVAILAAFTGAGKLAGTDGVALWAMGWSTPPLMAMWVLGAVRAYVIPNLPFIMIYMLAGRVLLAFLEAAIAVMIWAFAWIRMDGDELIAQQQRTGAMLMFHVMLAAPIGILAYCACFILLPLLVGGIEVLWPTAFYGQTGGYMVGLGAMITLFALMTWFIVWLCMNLFGQIFGLPDRVMTWFGVPAGSGFTDKGDFTTAAMAAAVLLNRAQGVPKPGAPKKPTDKDNGGGKGDGSGITRR